MTVQVLQMQNIFTLKGIWVEINTVKWLAHLLCIDEVMGSNLSPEIGHPDSFFPFPGFLLLQANAGVVL
jgi:hypothetical protein